MFSDLKSINFRGPIEFCLVVFNAKAWYDLTMVRNKTIVRRYSSK